MTKRQLRRAAALLDQYADELFCGNSIGGQLIDGTTVKRDYNDSRDLAEALRKAADK